MKPKPPTTTNGRILKVRIPAPDGRTSKGEVVVRRPPS
jgi:hypothetical protein